MFSCRGGGGGGGVWGRRSATYAGLRLDMGTIQAKKRGLAATSCTHGATERAASTRKCLFMSCPGVHAHKRRVLSVSKQRDSRTNPLWLKGKCRDEIH